MPRQSSDIKNWLRLVITTCPKCEKPVKILMDKRNNCRPPKKLCSSCRSNASGTSDLDVPTDWRYLSCNLHLCGEPKILTQAEIAHLVKNNRISPLYPGVLYCPAFGIFKITSLEVPENSGIDEQP